MDVVAEYRCARRVRQWRLIQSAVPDAISRRESIKPSTNAG